jgi:hypothetical protein
MDVRLLVETLLTVANHLFVEVRMHFPLSAEQTARPDRSTLPLIQPLRGSSR